MRRGGDPRTPKGKDESKADRKPGPCGPLHQGTPCGRGKPLRGGLYRGLACPFGTQLHPGQRSCARPPPRGRQAKSKSTELAAESATLVAHRSVGLGLVLAEIGATCLPPRRTIGTRERLALSAIQTYHVHMSRTLVRATLVCLIVEAAMATGYEHDVFISYKQDSNPGAWVHEHFYPTLIGCLSDECAIAPKVFVDKTGIRVGDLWKSQILKSLQTSKIIIPIWSPQYFESRFCIAELRTFLDREQALGMASAGNPQGLIYPIVYSDGEHFPSYAKARQYVTSFNNQSPDFNKLNCPLKQFKDSLAYIEFFGMVRDIAKDISVMLKDIPPWSPDWSAVDPDSIELTTKHAIMPRM